MSNYTENKTPNLIINTLEDPSKLSGITVGENEIILVPDETEEELAKKVDKTTENNKIYGTDEQGNQTTYDKDSFGQVDDVQVDGVSVVTNKIANIDLTGKVDKTSETEKVYGTDNNGNQVVYSAGNNIEFYNKSPQVFHGEEGKTYTEVGSLKSEDGQYIDTKLRYNSNQKGPTYDITFRYISIEGGSSYNGAVFGARAITGYWGIGIDSFGGKLRIVHGGDNIYNVIDKNTDTNWHRVYSTYDLNADGGTTYYYYDDELVFQTTKQFTTSDLTMVVFGKRSEDSVSVDSPIEIASFKWYDDSGNALLDYVPAVSSTGEAGFYDKVSEEFKVSATGASPEVVPFVEEHKINAIEPVVFRRIIEE